MCVVRSSLNDGGSSTKEGADGKGDTKAVTKSNGVKDIEPVFEIVEEKVEYERYMSLYNRKVRFPSVALGSDDQQGAVYEFDVIGHPKSSFCFCVALPFHPPKDGKDWREGEITMIREYAQGPNEMMYGLPAGAFHSGKHATAEGCARAELSEEAHLQGGKIFPLLEEGCDGVAEVKWCRNKFIPFLVYDPQHDACPGARDTEEYIEIVRMKLPEIKKLCRQGKMLLPSVTTIYWGLEWLAENYSRVHDA